MSVATVCNRSSSSKADGGNKKSKHSNNLEHAQTARDNTPTRPLILRCPSAVTRAAAAAPVLCRRPPASVTEKAKMIKAPLPFVFLLLFFLHFRRFNEYLNMISIRSECRRGHTVQANYYTDFYPNSKAARGYLAHMANIKQTFNLRSEMPLSLSSVDCGRVCFCELATSTAAFLFAECTATM